MAKYVFVCGGVYSGCGKGVAACSIGLLLKMRGFVVQYLKLDGYLNSDGASTIRPSDHGEVFVCDDGTECDLDIGHAERIIGVPMGNKNIATSGSLHRQLILEQEEGKYLGATCQITPHLTDLIQNRFLDLGKDSDIVIVELGGSCGDPESYAFFEATRQFKQEHNGDVLIAMVAPILWIPTIQEFKTKPLQSAIKELQRQGLQLDALLCRTDREVPEKVLDKIALTTGVKRERILVAPDVQSIYQVAIEFYNRHLDDLFVDLFRLNRSACRIYKYRDIVEKNINNNLASLEIGVVCKYENQDAYISLKEACAHAGITNDVKVNIRWIKAEDLEKYKDNRGLHKYFDGLHGVIVPGGFDSRGIEGKIKAIQYVREKKIPFLGICLGLQCAVIEFARNVCEINDAHSLEINPSASNPVIHFVEGQEGLRKKSASMRLGSYNCELTKDSLVFELYGNKLIKERHRHRYEVNPIYISQYEEKGFKVSGTNPETGLVEMMELDKSIHPYFIGCQAHPEFKSRLTNAAPLFNGLIAAAVKTREITIHN